MEEDIIADLMRGEEVVVGEGVEEEEGEKEVVRGLLFA